MEINEEGTSIPGYQLLCITTPAAIADILLRVDGGDISLFRRLGYAYLLQHEPTSSYGDGLIVESRLITSPGFRWSIRESYYDIPYKLVANWKVSGLFWKLYAETP